MPLKESSMSKLAVIRKQIKFIYNINFPFLKPFQLWVIRKFYYPKFFKIIDDELPDGVREQIRQFENTDMDTIKDNIYFKV